MPTRTEINETFDLYLESLVAAWRRTVAANPWWDQTLTEYLGMTPDEYGAWYRGELDMAGYDRLICANPGWGAQLAAFQRRESRRAGASLFDQGGLHPYNGADRLHGICRCGEGRDAEVHDV